MDRVEPPANLRQALNFKLVDEVLRYDFLVGILGGGGGVWLAVGSPATLSHVLPVAATIVGIVIGAVLAGTAILAAFLDQAFLRKLRAINREPVRYLAPFLFTATLGVFAALLLLVMVALPKSTPAWLLATGGGFTGLFVFWTLASVLANLNVLVEFVGLQYDASEVPEIRPRRPAPPDGGETEPLHHESF
jgi:hypothetical protein